MKIQAAVVREKNGSFQLEQLELDDPRDYEVLVKIVGVGICHTDLTCRDQYYPAPLPAVFGHEGSGIVERVGAKVTKVCPGDHVVLSYRACGHCSSCLGGDSPHCDEIFAYNFSGTRDDQSYSMNDGENPVHGNFFGQSSFASFALAHESNTVKVTKDVPLELLGPLGCGIQTGAGAVINTLAPKAGSSIAVFGCGAVGLAAIMAAKIVGCTKIIAVDLHQSRLELARTLGATDMFCPGEIDPVQAIHAITGRGVDFSVECTGLPGVFRQSVDALNVIGVCALVGAAPLGTEASLDMNTIMFGRTIKGVIEGDAIPDIFIPKMIDLYTRGMFPFDKLVSYYSLNEINQAVSAMEQGKVIKAVLRP